MAIHSLKIKGFKGFNESQTINFSKLNLLFGANSSGKSSTIQTLMLLKQTFESKGGQFDLLLNGKYVSLGSNVDIINKNSNRSFSIGIKIAPDSINDTDTDEILNIDELADESELYWEFDEDVNKLNNISIDKIIINDNIEFIKEKESNDFINISSGIDIKKIEVKNLIPRYITFQYDNNYNAIIHGILSDFYDLINPNTSRKIVKWNKEADYFDEYHRITDCLLDAFSNVKEKEQKSSKEHFNTFSKLDNLLKILEERLIIYENTEFMRMILQRLFSILVIPSKIKEFEDIIRKYEIKLQEVSSQTSIPQIKERRKLVGRYVDNNVLYKEIPSVNAIISARHNLQSNLKKINYLGPIRERPKSIYEYESDQNAKYVGKDGQHLPGIIAYFSELKINVPLPSGEIKENITFINALNKWSKYLGIADDIKSKISNVLSVNVTDGGIESNITNVGVGVSQVLPVISMGLLSQNHDILIFEQPELHLHPFVQSRLIDFFIELSNSGRQIIIESHSEYFIHRLRYKMLNQDISKKDVKILFFNKTSKGVSVEEAVMGEFGDIEYPDGFKDATENLIDEILNKQMEMLNND